MVVHYIPIIDAGVLQMQLLTLYMVPSNHATTYVTIALCRHYLCHYSGVCYLLLHAVIKVKVTTEIVVKQLTAIQKFYLLQKEAQFLNNA